MRAKYIKVNRNKQQSPKTQKQTKKQTNKGKKNLKKHLTDKPYKRAETLKKKHKTIDYN